MPEGYSASVALTRYSFSAQRCLDPQNGPRLRGSFCSGPRLCSAVLSLPFVPSSCLALLFPQSGELCIRATPSCGGYDCLLDKLIVPKREPKRTSSGSVTDIVPVLRLKIWLAEDVSDVLLRDAVGKPGTGEHDLACLPRFEKRTVAESSDLSSEPGMGHAACEQAGCD